MDRAGERAQASNESQCFKGTSMLWRAIRANSSASIALWRTKSSTLVCAYEAAASSRARSYLVRRILRGVGMREIRGLRCAWIGGSCRQLGRLICGLGRNLPRTRQTLTLADLILSGGSQTGRPVVTSLSQKIADVAPKTATPLPRPTAMIESEAPCPGNFLQISRRYVPAIRGGSTGAKGKTLTCRSSRRGVACHDGKSPVVLRSPRRCCLIAPLGGVAPKARCPVELAGYGAVV
jgi:hypothetical protein